MKKEYQTKDNYKKKESNRNVWLFCLIKSTFII